MISSRKIASQTRPIAETSNYIILDTYVRQGMAEDGYQTEADLERQLIADLERQGYEFLRDLTTPDALLANVRVQLERLNQVSFSDAEWVRFVDEYLDKPSDTLIDKTRKVHDDYKHDFVFDSGRIQNVYLVDKVKIRNNKLQVIRQFEQKGVHANRYDVTLLVNGLPLVQVELKKRGVAIREAFNQIHRYSKESFNSDRSLFKYLQLFVISNGTDTRYFANTTKRDKNAFDFTMNWALADNRALKDLTDFTATFLQQETLLKVLLLYCVFDTSDTLLVMRPYQIAATERMMRKVRCAYEAKLWNKPEGGGFIWHTTGSGKTLTSFKAARLATELDFVDKVLFVVDRKDLDYQTMKEYQRFSPDSVNGSDNTAGLKRNLADNTDKIVVTTIQKLNNLMKGETALPVYGKHVVLIFDECHRSQFGEAQKNLKRRFKRFYQFGFTGTPIFPDNARGAETTASVFGKELHAYVITDAIRDEKVLKFKVDYNDVRPKFRQFETEVDEAKLSAAETREALLHPGRIEEVSKYILANFRQKTHRLQGGDKGFNALFAVSSVQAAKSYYQALKALQADSAQPLKIATIFSFAANEEQESLGAIADESFDVSALDLSAKEFLQRAVHDYNALFQTSFTLDSRGFQNYYRDLANRVKRKQVDLLIVVGMFLTGFDAPTLNTLFVDRNLRYHGLIQAYSRTNRIYNSTKTFGNIVTFRDLEAATIEAIRVFGDQNTSRIVLEKSYQDYMEGFCEAEHGEARKGFLAVVNDLTTQFPHPDQIVKEADKKAFVTLFGEYLRLENVLQNYDEFTALKAFQGLDTHDPHAVETFKRAHHLSDESLTAMAAVNLPTDRTLQDYRSTYNDIRDWLRNETRAQHRQESEIDWDEVVFEVDLLKSQEINLDYILEQIFERNKQTKDKAGLVEDIRRMIRASLGNRAKEGLVVAFIKQADLEGLHSAAGVMEAFYAFAQAEQRREAKALIESEGLNAEPAKRYMAASIKREYASDQGTELNAILPKMSPLNPQYLTKKRAVFQRVQDFVAKFSGIGGGL